MRLVKGSASMLLWSGLVVAAVAAAEPDPEIPPGAPDAPGTVRVALVDSGVNYTLPAINARLARDESGQLVGYDFWDLDERPFDAHPVAGGRVQRHGTRTASVLIAETSGVALVPYRYPRPDMQRMRELVEHAARHDVRIVGLPLGGNLAAPWQAFEEAARSHPDMLFIASAGNNGRDIDRVPVYPASLELDNLLVVTSADDFVRPARGSNVGRRSVDYLVPAESVPVLEFDGREGLAAGSSYAVPRVMALAARLLQEDSRRDAAELIAEIRRRHADGRFPVDVSRGYLADPQRQDNAMIDVVGRWSIPLESGPVPTDESSVKSDEKLTVESTASLAASPPAIVRVAVDVLVIEPAWSDPEVERILREGLDILEQCALVFAPIDVQRVRAPDYLRDLATGPAHTLMNALRSSGPARRLTVVFARDSRMQTPFEAEAFGRANSRTRPWLQDSVWLTRDLRDAPIALAHEVYHVSANRGDHHVDAGNLMAARTSGSNTSLLPEQCKAARDTVLENRLGQPL